MGKPRLHTLDPQQTSTMPSPDAPTSHNEGASFSVQDIRDRVVIMALFYQHVDEVVVERAWHGQRERARATGHRMMLWRLLLEQPEVQPEQLYQLAAKVYGYDEVEITPLGTLAVITRVAERFTPDQWYRLIELCLVPVKYDPSNSDPEARWIFATHDPTRPAVRQALTDFGFQHFTLCYAPEALLVEALTRAFSDAGDDAYGMDGLHEEEATKARASKLRASVVDIFEDALLAAAEEDARAVHFGADADGDLVIHLRTTLREVSLEPPRAIAYESFQQFFLKDVVEVQPGVVGDAKATRRYTIQRWINHQLRQCVITVHPYRGAADPSLLVVRLA